MCFPLNFRFVLFIRFSVSMSMQSVFRIPRILSRFASFSLLRSLFWLTFWKPGFHTHQKICIRKSFQEISVVSLTPLWDFSTKTNVIKTTFENQKLYVVYFFYFISLSILTGALSASLHWAHQIRTEWISIRLVDSILFGQWVKEYKIVENRRKICF